MVSSFSHSNLGDKSSLGLLDLFEEGDDQGWPAFYRGLGRFISWGCALSHPAKALQGLLYSHSIPSAKDCSCIPLF
jgi:hypothetical protein